MSLINKEDLMQTLGITTDMDCEKCGWYSRTARRCKRGSDFEDACFAIENAPEVKPEQQWIPCSERLPEEAQECWIATKDGTVGQGMFTKRYGERRGSGFICYGCGFAWLNAVVAWMPYQLPEPYREEGEQE